LKKKILIFGGSGFIGHNLILKLLKKNFIITSVSRKKDQTYNINNKNLTNIKCDVSKKKLLKEKITTNFDYVINLSGNIDHKKKAETIRTHYIGCKNILNFVTKKNIKLFIQIGSSLEYGNVPSPQKETSTCKPNSIYGLAKLKASNYIKKFIKKKNFSIIILRLYQVYGPYQKFDRLIPQVIKACLKDKKFKCSDGSQLRDFIYIDDLIDLIEKIIKKNKNRFKIFNVGYGKPFKVKKIIEVIKDITKKGKPQYGLINMRKDEAKVLYPQISSVRKTFKWKPKTKIFDGLKKTILFYKKNMNKKNKKIL
jgi:nucleoside-diphosphate-sugar epimerase